MWNSCIWQRSFFSTVRPTVHTNPSRKRSFISTVTPTVHTNLSRKRSFSKTLHKTEESRSYETLALRFSVHGIRSFFATIATNLAIWLANLPLTITVHTTLPVSMCQTKMQCLFLPVCFNESMVNRIMFKFKQRILQKEISFQFVNCFQVLM